MISGIGVVLSFFSVLFFPWLATVLLVLGTAFFEPWAPFVVGLFVDTLYYAPVDGSLPWYTIFGAVATIIVFFVRSRLKTGIISR